MKNLFEVDLDHVSYEELRSILKAMITELGMKVYSRRTVFDNTEYRFLTPTKGD